ncbi:hypothetical protein M885DRAFT_624177 [Pelagophyceae sp. CCMP2097]|nr:hypothetical protein M885DRAFT_624177 [Pelagophyceae sp. CCMP2097]
MRIAATCDEAVLYRELGNGPRVHRSRDMQVEAVYDLLARAVAPAAARDGKRFVENKLRRKALNLVDVKQSKRKRARPPAPHADGPRPQRRKAQAESRAARNAEVSNWAATAPLRLAWVEYAKTQLGFDKQAENAARLAKHVDFHGALIEVLKSPSNRLVGAFGTVIEETPQTWRILEPAGKKRTLQKAHLVFLLHFAEDRGARALLLRGDDFVARAS